MNEGQSELLGRISLDSALDEELTQVPDLLPRQIIDEALQEDADGVADYLRESALGGVEAQPTPKVVALKWRHGRRTVSMLPLYERVMYRAVVQSLADDLVPRVRDAESFLAFQTAATMHDGTRYVVMTDLANYYASIDLDRLSSELLRRTGRWAQVEWLRSFWDITSDGYGGIPQMNTASDIVGDTYADQLHRRLLRNGLAAWRYADDFRIACPTYGDCVSALELLDEQARLMGLTLNERKTLTPGVEKYVDIIEGPQRRLARINEQVEADLTQFNPYDFELIEPEQAEVLEAGAVTAIELWVAERSNEETALDSVDISQVLPQCLIILGVRGNPGGLPHITQLLRYEPQFTPTICRYLRFIAPAQSELVAAAVWASLRDLTLTRWQRHWLLYVMEVIDPTLTWAFGDELLSWMHSQVADESVPLRCQAAWSLARSNQLTLAEWQTLDPSSRYAAPYAAACLPGLVGVGSDMAKLAPTGLLESKVFNWSIATHFI